MAPTSRVMVEREDGAMISAAVYSPDGMTEEPGKPFGIDMGVPPLVLLHGNGEDSTTLAPLIETFRQERSVIAIDSRGQGLSSRGTAPLTYETMAADALEVMSRMSVTRAHVMGYSDGAIIGLLMASGARHRVLTLTAMGANVTPEGLTPETREEIREAVASLRASGRPAVGDPEWHAAARELLELMLTGPHIVGERLRSIVCPTLVLVGEHDVVLLPHTLRIVREVPDARLCLIGGASHELVVEKPDVVVAEMRAQMSLNDPRLAVRAPRARENLAVVPLGPEHWGLVEEVYERVLDTCEGPDADTSGWKRGHWPDYDNVRNHLAAGSMRGCFRVEDLNKGENGLEPAPDAAALGVMSVDHDIAVDEAVINWPARDAEDVFCLHLFATNPQFRGQGAADALLADFIDEGLREGVDAFRLNTSPENVTSNGLYQARGFELYRAAYFPYRGLALTPWSNCYELTAERARELRDADPS